MGFLAWRVSQKRQRLLNLIKANDVIANRAYSKRLLRVTPLSNCVAILPLVRMIDRGLFNKGISVSREVKRVFSR